MYVPEKSQPLLVTSILFTSIAFVTVMSRLLTRLFIIKYAGADDWLMLASLCASIGFMVVVIFQIKYGLGSPIASFEEGQIQKFLQALWATIPVYNLSLVLCKLSIICQYMRVFATAFVLKLCKIMICILVVYGCWTVFGSAFMCVPVQFFWGEGKGSCMNRLAFWFSNAALNITTDLLIFAIPIPLIRGLQISSKQKTALIFVFAFGAFVCVTSVIRLHSLYLISISTDTSLDGVDCAIWSGIEINVAISCASMPALKPLISRAFPGLLSSHARSTNAYGNISNSYHLQSVRNKQEIHIEQTVDIKAERRASNSGSERNLVDWNTDCQSDTTTKNPAQGRELV